MCAASAGADGFGSRFVQPVAENGLRMGGSPAVWQHFVQARIICMEAEKQVADIAPRLNTMTLGARQDRVQHGGSWAGCFIAQEEPILTFMRSFA